jgi:hypothetical protein
MGARSGGGGHDKTGKQAKRQKGLGMEAGKVKKGKQKSKARKKKTKANARDRQKKKKKSLVQQQAHTKSPRTPQRKQTEAKNA